jgi:N-methylhydantoinase A/oxoprolinase/acetone carboxylase beta subunit
MTLDVERARAAIRNLAGRLELSEVALTEGIVRVANANMERAIRVVSVQRGFDPRDFALLAFGGAGGMHACEIAATLEIATVIVPRHAGVLSALGMLLADVTKDYSVTVLRKGQDAEPCALEPLFDPLDAQARRELAAEGFAGDDMQLARAVDVRYVGQSFEITVPFAAGYRQEFDRQHARLYGYANPWRPAEVVNLRVTATGFTRKPELPRRKIERSVPAEPSHTGPAQFGGRIVPTRFYRWESLAPGSIADGPAVVAGAQATSVIPPGFTFRIDEFGNLLAVRSAARPQARRRERARASVS